jgi:hypothetical protein
MQGKVVFVISGDPALAEWTSTSSIRMVARPGVGEGRKTVDAG